MINKIKSNKISIIGFIILGLILVTLTNDNYIMNDYTQNNVIEVKGKVLEVDDSEVINSGVASIGYQTLRVKIINGDYKGEIVKANNNLLGQMDIDNIYKVNDKAIIALQIKDKKIINVKAIDLYRQNWTLILFLSFVACLLLYAGIIGIKALISFALSLFVLWDYLIKGLLNGKDPIMLTTVTVILLTAIIIFLVAGFTKKGISAFIGTISGLGVTLILTHFFGDRIGLYGMTQPYVQTLIINGYYDLNIQQIFYAAIILGASGAAMDIAMDIAASMDEIKNKKPDIKPKELIKSGFNVGRHVIGTMATTLLLAYSGGYLTLLMVFMMKNSSFLRIINLRIVSAEIMRTLIGSMGLILVAPITAIVAGLILDEDILKKFIKPLNNRGKI